ncbi:MAG: type II toxin-antitoxin system RelE/ParE family toxin [Nanoarchaeota archaeon]
MIFSIEYAKQPLQFLKKQDKHIVGRIIDKIDETLPNNPVPHNAVAIVGEHGVFRIRIGDYRVLYRVNYQEMRIIVITLDKRPRAYD